MKRLLAWKRSINSLKPANDICTDIPIILTYVNKGCTAYAQPNLKADYYKSLYYYNSQKDGYWSGYLGPNWLNSISRVQPFQFLAAGFPIPCYSSNPLPIKTCRSEQVPGNTPQGEKEGENSPAYVGSNKNGLVELQGKSPDDSAEFQLTVPPGQMKEKKYDGIKNHLKEQSSSAEKIVLEMMSLFSLAQKNGEYDKANEFWKALIGNNNNPNPNSNDILPDNKLTVHQLIAPGQKTTNPDSTTTTGALDNLVKVAKLIYGPNSHNSSGEEIYDLNLISGRQRGMSYNTKQTDRIHIGF